MIIDGTVQSVVFSSDETGYRVLRLDSNIVAIGHSPFISTGAEYRFHGNFVNSARHGRQFQFTKLELLPPDTESKIIAFLGGGLVEGVGPSTAMGTQECQSPKSHSVSAAQNTLYAQRGLREERFSLLFF